MKREETRWRRRRRWRRQFSLVIHCFSVLVDVTVDHPADNNNDGVFIVLNAYIDSGNFYLLSTTLLLLLYNINRRRARAGEREKNPRMIFRLTTQKKDGTGKN